MAITTIPVKSQIGNKLPIIDGVESPDEWSLGEEVKIGMTAGVDLSFTHLYSDTDMYFLIKLPHNAPEDVINTNVSTGAHDYFGIEFDRNGDSVIMGTSESPDDMVLVDYIDQGAVDLYSYGYKVYEDILNDGTEDTEGVSNGVNGTILYEIRKPLKSNDEKGFDVSLKTGDVYQIMVAFWDNKFPHSAAIFTNREIGGEFFLQFRIGDPIHPVTEEFITLFFIGMAIVAFYIIESYRKSMIVS